MRILVTGATGFIGSRLACRLAGAGNEVVGLARETSSKERIAELEKCGVKIHRVDLLKPETLAGLPKDFDFIFHLAAVLDHSITDYRVFHEANVVATRNLAELYLKQNVKNFVFTSSIAAIGRPKTNSGIVDESVECNPVTPYGRSKFEAEQLLLDYHRKSGFPVTILRPPTVYGPGGQDGLLEMVKFVEGKMKGRAPIIHIGRGDTLVTFCYIDNLVDALVLAMGVKEKGEIFHVDDGRPYTDKEVLDTISRVLGGEPLEIYIPKILFKLLAYSGDLLETTLGSNPLELSRNNIAEHVSLAYDIGKARERFGYRPKGDLESLVARSIAWYRATRTGT